MHSFKHLFLLTVLFFSGLIVSLQSSCLNLCGNCSSSFQLGADLLIWSPCISNQHYALDTERESTKTRNLCNEWNAGVRVYMKTEDVGNSFGGSIAYTYFKPKASSSYTPVVDNAITFSNALPVNIGTGDSLSAEWKAEYQSADLLVSSRLSVARNQCFRLEAFAGVTWLDVEQNRTDTLFDDPDTIDEEIYTVHRHNEFWAVGPAIGIHSSFRLCGCFQLFGTVKASGVLGKSESIDTLTHVIEGELNFENVYLAKDNCSCFPGLHLMAGIDYDFCVGDADAGIRLGWEYVLWGNAPTFSVYEQGEGGVRSANSATPFSMQGIFIGLNASF